MESEVVLAIHQTNGLYSHKSLRSMNITRITTQHR